MEERISSIEAKIEGFAAEIRSLGEIISKSFTKVDNNFDSIGKQFLNLRNQVEILNKKVDQLQGATHEGFDGVGEKLESLTDEIKKIASVTGYDEQFSNLKGLN